MLKKEYLKVIIISSLCALFDIILHGIISPLSSSDISTTSPSILVEKGYFFQTVIGWALVTFLIMALVYKAIYQDLNYTKISKGFLYGLCLGGLYFIGMFEVILLKNSKFIYEFLMGLGDFLPIVLMGTLLGVFLKSESKIKTNDQNNKKSFACIFIIGFVYLIGRYFAYSIINIESAYITKPIGTFIWTLSQGMWIGLIYYILNSGEKGSSDINKSIFFGGIIYGSCWLMNHIFILLISEFKFDLLIRSSLDILFVILGIYIYKKTCKFKIKN